MCKTFLTVIGKLFRAETQQASLADGSLQKVQEYSHSRAHSMLTVLSRETEFCEKHLEMLKTKQES